MMKFIPFNRHSIKECYLKYHVLKKPSCIKQDQMRGKTESVRTGKVCEIYFTPDCKFEMEDLIKEYNFKECVRPNYRDVIGLCTVVEFESLVWR